MNTASVYNSQNEEGLDVSEMDQKVNQILDYPENFSEEAIKLLEYYQWFEDRMQGASGSQTVKVGEVLSSVAFVYEKIRNSVDFKGEHLLMRNAIERIMRRKNWESLKKTPDEIAEEVITELIWARYLKNDTLPVERLNILSSVIAKYLRLLDNLSMISENDENKKWKGWVFGVASCEIEEIIQPMIFFRIEALGWAMYSWFKSKFDWRDIELTELQKDIQINVAVHKSLFRSDEARIRYHLLRHFYPEWEETTEEEVAGSVGRFIKTANEIDEHIGSQVQSKLYRFVQKHTAAFQILDEIVREDPYGAEELFKKPKALSKKIKIICNRRYDEAGQKVNRGIIRSIIYIFATKVIFAILVEVPYEIYVLEEMSIIPLAINVMVPPIFMFILGLTIKKPSEDNTKRIIEKIKDFLYIQEEEIKFDFSLTASKGGSFLSTFFLLLYASMFMAVFTGITWILLQFNFNIVSAGIFFMFISMVLLFGFRIRYTASELKVVGEREGLVSHLITNLMLPFLNLGHWLSGQLVKINVFIVLLDFLIEVPLKNMMGIFEQWASFIKEKREEVIEVPT